MNDSPKRLLFFAESVTLAHVARCIAIAKALSSHGHYHIAFATDSRFDRIIGDAPFRRYFIDSVSCSYFCQRLANGLPVYDRSRLTSYVNEDLRVIEDFSPDFIFGDFRLSLAISSRLAKVPYATITNAYWSPYADIDYPVPEISLTKWLGVNAAQKIFDSVRPLVFWWHALALKQVCKKFRLPPLEGDMREVYTHADFTLYADIESLIPMRSLPENHVFIGPVLWSVPLALPSWWGELPGNKPIVFVTLGSSGDIALLPKILNTLGLMDITAICVTAEKISIDIQHQNIFVAEYLPAEIAVKKADIVICNGGSPMVYQSLVENKSIIGIPTNLDQYLMMSALVNAERGQLIRAGQVDTFSIQRAVERALSHQNTPLTKTPTLDADKIINLLDSV